MEDEVKNWGLDIDTCIKREMAKLSVDNKSIKITFNRIEFYASVCESVDTVRERYMTEFNKIEEKRKESKNYIQQRKARKLEIEARNDEMFNLMKEFAKIDYSDHYELIDWFHRLHPIANDSDVYTASKEIVFTLETFGYKKNANLNEEFDRNDSTNYAKYIIGQAIVCLDKVGSMPDVLNRFMIEWMSKNKSENSD